MAPKKPAAPPPPPPPAEGEEVIHVPKFKAIPPEVKWRVIRLFGVFCFVVFIAATVAYIKLLNAPPSPYIEPMNSIRRTMSNALRKPAISALSDMGTAEEVIQLPNYQEDTEKAYLEKKNKYQSIFKKGSVKAATHWTLFGKNLYYISIGRKTWYDAQNFCLSRDSHMVSILNDEEQKFVSLQFNESAWIGLSDENDEGIWQWSDGSRLTIQFWDVGSPTILKKNGEMERDCAYISPSSGVFNWKDDNCHTLKQWVCKEIIVMEDLEYLSQP
ncbi:CD209 antigen-like isoform X1 [Crotalus tigris]|uniref:CD209 antigen-like isoform X1 n=1 Tax=Crotalus tigris TaxID=88082 RepID=UPI00192F7001|nr:CD209 antigen-like isoform X1 [Crotalus tigris]XP_039189885.1 CD209 antigen-like isoform X1 [Crotalus tigris]XP_039189886.1 CD209 antigen-like isoform X1 [Crotalus tigris]